MTRYFRWIGVLSLLVICAVGPGLCADELVAPGVDTVTSFTGATVADYDLKVTLATQTIVVTGGSSGPGEAQVIPSLGAVSGPGDEKIGFVSHKGGSASYLVWGGYGGGSGSGSPSRWTNQYTTGSASTAYFSIYIGDRNTTDDDYFTLDSSSTVTVELHNAQPNQTYKVVLTQSSEDGGAVIGLPSSDQPISEGSPVVLSVTGSGPGNITIFATNATTSTAPATQGAINAPVTNVTITGPGTTRDGDDSTPFTVTLHPPGTGTITYAWHWKAPNGSGNNPQVTFANPDQAQTIITAAHWFAMPGVQEVSKGANEFRSTYTIWCTVTVNGQTRDSAPKSWIVQVPNPAGSCAWPSIQITGDLDIVSAGGGMFKLNSIQGIARNVPNPVVNLPQTSQFYDKMLAHENRHLAQNTPPGVGVQGITMDTLWNAQALYDNKLSKIRRSSKDLVQQRVIGVINAQNARDKRTANTEENSTGNDGKGILEQDAHRVSSNVAPFYLDWYTHQ